MPVQEASEGTSGQRVVASREPQDQETGQRDQPGWQRARTDASLPVHVRCASSASPGRGMILHEYLFRCREWATSSRGYQLHQALTRKSMQSRSLGTKKEDRDAWVLSRVCASAYVQRRVDTLE